MAPRTEGETRDERDILIGVVAARMGDQWQRLVAKELRAQPTWWFPWMLVYGGGFGSGTYLYPAKPSPAEVTYRKRLHRAQGVALVDMRGYLRGHIERMAAGALAGEDRWPLVDAGPSDWISS